MKETDLLPNVMQYNEDLSCSAFISRVSHPGTACNIMDLITCNRNITKLLRKTYDKRKRTLLTSILKANSRIIISM